MIWHRVQPGPHHRARVVALLGIIWGVIGVGILTQPPRDIGLIYERLPDATRALIWAIPGVIGVVASLWRRFDNLAWAVLIIPPAERASAFAWGWVTSTVQAAYLGAAIYLALSLLVYECAAGLDRPRNGGEAERWQPK